MHPPLIEAYLPRIVSTNYDPNSDQARRGLLQLRDAIGLLLPEVRVHVAERLCGTFVTASGQA